MDFSSDIEAALTVLRTGGIILYPTDTIWGIGCDATNAEAVAKIFRLKKREETKSMIVLLADERDLFKYVSSPDPGIFSFLQSRLKPTTVIYDDVIGLAPNLKAADGTVGIRIVQEAYCKHLVKRLRAPLVSTSANISGMPGPKYFAEISAEIREGVDYIATYRRNDDSPHQPSSVVKWSRGEITVLRD